MNIIIIAAISFLLSAQTGYSLDNYFSNKYGFYVVVPDGWRLDTNTANEVVLSDFANDSSYVSIKKYQIENDKEIGSDADLVAAISGLYRNLGIPAEKPEQIYYSLADGKAVFEVEFLGRDISGKAQKKRLKGVICRAADNGQILYLMIAVAPEEYYETIAPKFMMILRSFRITDDISPNLYSRPRIVKYFLIFVILVLTVFFFARNRKVQKSSHPLGRDSSNYWRCGECGRVNHVDVKFCHRCGAERKRDHVWRAPAPPSSTSSIKTPPHDAG
jgi:hypothetical protein